MPHLKSLAEEYVERGNIQSLDDRDRSVLIDQACAEVEPVHKPFPPHEHKRLDDVIERLRDQIRDVRGDLARAEGLLIPLQQKLGPPPKKERAAGIAVAAALAMYAFGIATSIQPAFAEMDDDPVIGWAYAVLFGLAGGVIITWSILGLQGRGRD